MEHSAVTAVEKEITQTTETSKRDNESLLMIDLHWKESVNICIQQSQKQVKPNALARFAFIACLDHKPSQQILIGAI